MGWWCSILCIGSTYTITVNQNQVWYKWNSLCSCCYIVCSPSPQAFAGLLFHVTHKATVNNDMHFFKVNLFFVPDVMHPSIWFLVSNTVPKKFLIFQPLEFQMKIILCHFKLRNFKIIQVVDKVKIFFIGKHFSHF